MKKIVFFKTILIPVVIIIGTLQINAQSNLSSEGELITPSTDSWNMIKYGTVGASLYTGTVNLSIPFYTYKDNDFTIPISFEYASNGNMPNQKAGILGPDWNLRVGGTITADIKGVPDYSSSSNLSFFALSRNAMVTGRDLSKIFRFVNLDYRITTGMHSPIMLYCPDGYPNTPGNKYDSEPDLYNFNFMGFSGAFHRGYGDTTYVYGTNTNNKDFRVIFAADFSLITIITSDGYKYEFNTGIGNADLVEEEQRNLRVAWKLTRIVAPNGRKAIFNYSSYTESNCQPSSIDVAGTLTQLLSSTGQNMEDVGMQWEHNITELIKTNRILNSISIDNGPNITFDYSQLAINQSDEFAPIANPSIPTVLESHRLTGISVTDPNNTLIKECFLTYKNNNAGKRINYLASVNISGEGLFQMDYYNWSNYSRPFPGNGTLSVDHWGYYNGKNNTNSAGIPFLKLGYINNRALVITSDARNADATYAKCGMLEKITYPTGVYSLFEYEAHDYSKAFKRQNSYIMTNENGVCGGLRLKSISNYNSASELSSSRSFEYTDGTNSSGILLHFPVYYAEYTAYTTNGISENNIRYYSSSINSYNSTHIEYSKVIEKHNDNSQVVYEYTNSALSENYADGVCVAEVVAEPFGTYGSWSIGTSLVYITAPITSMQAERGKLLSKKVYNAGSLSNPVQTETNTYNSGTALAIDYLPAYFIREIGYYIKYIDNYKQTSHNLSELRNGINVSNGEKYNYNNHGQLVRKASRDSKGDSLITKYTYVTDLPSNQITSGSVYKAMLDSNIISYPLKEELYLKKPGNSEVLISGKKYTYINPVSSNKRIVKVSKVELYDKNNATWYTDIEYTQFDSKGNVLESRDKNGLFSCYIWGYNGLYLVAKVEGGLSLNNLKSAISGLSNISTTPLTGAMISGAQNTLKTSWPSVKMTVYEYIPFVGLSKIIDPSGKVTEYQYNASGKLKGIKDGNNQFHNEYFYSPDNKL